MSRSIVLICVLNCFITMAQTKPSLPYIPDPADTLLSKIDSSRYKSPTNVSIQLKKQLITNTKNDEYNNQLFIINDLLTHFPDKLSTVEKVNLYIQATDVYKKTGKYWYAKTTIDSALSNTNRYTYKTQLEKILSFKIEICNTIGLADTSLFIINSELIKNNYSINTKVKYYPELARALYIKGALDSAQQINNKMYEYSYKTESIYSKSIQASINNCFIEITKGNSVDVEKKKQTISKNIANAPLSNQQRTYLNQEITLIEQDILAHDGKYDLVIKNIQSIIAQKYKADTIYELQDTYAFKLRKRLANAYFNKGKYNDAIANINICLLFLTHTISDDCYEAGNLQDLLAQIYYEKSDYGYALTLADRSINIHKSTDGINTLNYSESITTKGLIEIAIEHQTTALNNLKEALVIRISLLGENHLLTGISYNNLGLAYRLTHNFEAADTCFKKAADNYTLNIKNQYNPYFARIHNDIGTIEQNTENFNEAIENYILSLKIYRKLYGTLQPDVADGFYNVATLFQRQKQYHRALIATQESFISNIPNYTDTIYTSNPPIDQAISDFLLLRTMYLKAQLLQEYAYLQSDKSQRTHYLENALTCYLITGKIIDKLRRGYVSEDSKLFLTEKTAVMYEEAIRITRQLRLNSNAMDMDNIAFQLSESSKAGVLIGTINEANAKKVSGIPDSLLVYEQSLHVQLLKGEKLLINELKKGAKRDTVLIATYQKSLFDLKSEYVIYINKLEIAYPKYHELKYKQQTATIQEVQHSIVKNESGKKKDDITLLEYFLGRDSIYIFCITANTYDVLTVKKDSMFTKNIIALRNGISLKIDNVFMDSSIQLFDQLIAPVTPYIKGKNIVIVPDVLISNLPFQTLINHTTTSKKAIENKELNAGINYLVNDYQLSFLYSATLGVDLLAHTINTSYTNSMIAFAPVFNTDSTLGNTITNKSVAKNNLRYFQPKQDEYNPVVANNNVSYLPMTLEEVSMLGKLMQSSKDPFVAYVNQFADERVLKDSTISNYAIIHFASHNNIDLGLPKESGLYFAIDKKTNEDGILKNSELYNINLHSKLVVMSACETALGTTIPGEGIIGLSRGFIYAGTSNIIVSLWKINDASTAEQIKTFYTQIKKGQSYKTSLQKAQLKMMKSKAYFQPYYWAPMILIGN